MVQSWGGMHTALVFVPSTVHAARSLAAFLGSGFIPLILLDITDNTFFLVLISELFAGHRRTSIVAITGKKFLAYPC